MENNKSPVNDGIPAEFYKIFWNDNSVFYIKVINTAHELGKLSISQKKRKNYTYTWERKTESFIT